MRLPLSDEAQDLILYTRQQLQHEGVADRLLTYEGHAPSAQKLEYLIRSAHRLHEADTIIIDYLQLLPFQQRRGETRESQLGLVAHRLHDLALELGLYIICLSQVNRAVQGAPTMHHLRDSGQIAEAADCILMLYNARVDGAEAYPPPHQTQSTDGTVMLSIEKFRNGPTYSLIIGFDRQHTRIYQRQPQLINTNLFKQ